MAHLQLAAETEFKPLLDQSVGYGVVVGVGFFFAAMMLGLTAIQARFSKFSPSSSEEFSSASRSVKASVDLGKFALVGHRRSRTNHLVLRWYGVGGTIQLAFFAIVAAKVKMNANGAHTFLEIVKTRFGTGAHLLFTFYAFLCILVVCGSLLLGGAATVNALTGMNIVAACFLLPIGIAVYVIFGGLRATFICDYTHTMILFVIIYVFFANVYGTSPDTGSITALYDLLVQAGKNTPVDGNKDGSYLTMKSNQGLVFGAATILSGFSGVFCDQGYWQRAIASAPRSTTRAYMLGGLSWFAVPWGFASCLGLAARALVTNPKFPTYPNPLSPSQTSSGLAAPAAAAVVMGKGGAVAILLVVFMAVTSAVSAELIAVSSVFLYRTYYRPQASSQEIVRVSHYFICFWAVWAGCWSTILHKASIDLGWLFYVQGVVLSPAVVPIALTVTWSKLTRAGVFAGSISGAVLGMLAWMIGCWKIYGEINVSNLAEPYSAVCSGLTGLLFSGIITVLVSLAKPANYDFSGTRAIAVYDDTRGSDLEAPSSAETRHPSEEELQEKKLGLEDGAVADVMPVEEDWSAPAGDLGISMEELKRVFRRATWYSLALTLIVAILVPLPMYFSQYIFGRGFYTFWVACTIIWAAMSGIFCMILPLWESRAEIWTILLAIAGKK
ncbi:hypothetical protein BN946_scf184908.g96 [Trametes cinnabarina]|uniref:Urea active transporter n=1 Tax=Pycnoporus cinnabarinus TaxID=5643 RepID=A0A060SG22_PYCCI|nr:hypothetical protein BN946_scf184908.g96 [Trametes cinnabarina]